MISLFGIIEVLIIPLRLFPPVTSLTLRNDYDGPRTGDRVVSVGEHPYFDPSSKSRREALKTL
jgi:hypothetical protein